jgi:TRAP-type C4-dicarboxylate transport system substrate-binding protein
MTGILKGAGIALAATLLAGASHAQMTLIGNDPGPNRGVRAAAVEHLGTLMSEASGGSVSIEQNWGGALFKATAALDSLSTGVADIGVIVGPYAQSELPELNIGAQPLPAAGPWVMMKAIDEMFSTNETIQQRLADRNIVYINSYSLPPNLFACNGDIVNSVADVEGTKISRTGSSSDIFKELGGNMVNMPIYEVYQSMETGLVDCTVTFSYFAVATKLHELLKTYAPMGLSAQTVVATFMNKDTFDGLSADEQAAVMTAAGQMSDYYGEKLSGADTKAMKAFADAGGVEKPFSDDDLSKIKASAQPGLDKWLSDAEATGLDGQALLDELIGLIAKWNGVAETEGFPWERG